MNLREQVFGISTKEEFTRLTLEVFRHNYVANEVYRRYVEHLGIQPAEVMFPEQIPFLPIRFFKSHKVNSSKPPPQAVFRSSGTTGDQRSSHHVADLGVYRQSLVRGFEHFFGSPRDFQFLALTPTPEQAPESSLVFMIQHLMDLSTSPENGFFLASFSGLSARLRQRRQKGRKVMLIGLSYALLDFAAEYPGAYPQLCVVETGGMKGQRRELTRNELHALLKPAFGVNGVFSEYGMTELLSQAWSTGQGLFRTPPWMRVMIRDLADPLSFVRDGEPGGINIIDLANFNSCSFIETEDMGRQHPDGSFEVLGRLTGSEARGCSQMV
jgi:hypothetical protein